jgi:hypothetical protein
MKMRSKFREGHPAPDGAAVTHHVEIAALKINHAVA